VPTSPCLTFLKHLQDESHLLHDPNSRDRFVSAARDKPETIDLFRAALLEVTHSFPEARPAFVNFWIARAVLAGETDYTPSNDRQWGTAYRDYYDAAAALAAKLLPRPAPTDAAPSPSNSSPLTAPVPETQIVPMAAPALRRKAGRAKKADKDSATKVIAALSAHHGYDGRMGATKFEPATNRQLAQTYGLANNALSRFLAGPEGYQKYKNACRNRTIGALLALWNREVPNLRIGLLLPDSESVAEEDPD
jgi:hypothetical protein